MTAGTLYEAVEPHAMWKELLQVTVADIVAAEDRVDVRFLPRNTADNYPR